MRIITFLAFLMFVSSAFAEKTIICKLAYNPHNLSAKNVDIKVDSNGDLLNVNFWITRNDHYSMGGGYDRCALVKKLSDTSLHLCEADEWYYGDYTKTYMSYAKGTDLVVYGSNKAAPRAKRSVYRCPK